MVTWTQDFTQVRALLMEVKPYILLLIAFIWGVVQSTCVYHEIYLMNIRCCLLTSLASVYIMHQRPRLTRVLAEYAGGEKSLS